MLTAIAPAKVNLNLHVLGKRADGYHALESVVVFTEFGDEIAIEAAGELSLDLSGEFAAASGDVSDNLVLRAAQKLKGHCAVSQGARIQLRKQIPVGAGLGGGSSDAACVLKLLRALWGVAVSDATLASIASDLGSDVPMCLHARPLIARGRGEEISLLKPPFPDYFMVLVYPHVALTTKDIFAAHRAGNTAAMNTLSDDDFPSLPALSGMKNHLQSSAISLCPEVAEVLLALQTAVQQPELVRMSGSGSCCFALFTDEDRALALHASLQQKYPHWWTRVTRMGTQ